MISHSSLLSQLLDTYTCAVCLGINDDAVSLPCRHEFHAACAQNLIAAAAKHHPKDPNTTCPTCKKPFKANELVKAFTTAEASKLLQQARLNQIAVKVHGLSEKCLLMNFLTNDEAAKIMRQIHDSNPSLNLDKAHLMCGKVKMDLFMPLSKYVENNQKMLDVQFINNDNASPLAPPKKNRAIYESELPAYIEIMKTKRFDFDPKAVLEASGNALIGLSQTVDFNQSCQFMFHCLEDMLGKPQYQYVPDNRFSTTTKLRKAATLYIVKGLLHPMHQTRVHALIALKKIVEDFRLIGHKSQHGKDYGLTVFALCRGYWESIEDKSQAAKILKEIWQQEACFLEELVKHYPDMKIAPID